MYDTTSKQFLISLEFILIKSPSNMLIILKVLHISPTVSEKIFALASHDSRTTENRYTFGQLIASQ